MLARWIPVVLLLALLPASASPQTEEVFAARRAAMVAEQLAARGIRHPAVLAEMGAEANTIEILAPLAAEAAKRLRVLGYGTVRLRPAMATWAGPRRRRSPPSW